MSCSRFCSLVGAVDGGVDCEPAVKTLYLSCHVTSPLASIGVSGLPLGSVYGWLNILSVGFMFCMCVEGSVLVLEI